MPNDRDWDVPKFLRTYHGSKMRFYGRKQLIARRGKLPISIIRLFSAHGKFIASLKLQKCFSNNKSTSQLKLTSKHTDWCSFLTKSMKFEGFLAIITVLRWVVFVSSFTFSARVSDRAADYRAGPIFSLCSTHVPVILQAWNWIHLPATGSLECSSTSHWTK